MKLYLATVFECPEKQNTTTDTALWELTYIGRERRGKKMSSENGQTDFFFNSLGLLRCTCILLESPRREG